MELRPDQRKVPRCLLRCPGSMGLQGQGSNPGGRRWWKPKESYPSVWEETEIHLSK